MCQGHGDWGRDGVVAVATRHLGWHLGWGSVEVAGKRPHSTGEFSGPKFGSRSSVALQYPPNIRQPIQNPVARIGSHSPRRVTFRRNLSWTGTRISGNWLGPTTATNKRSEPDPKTSHGIWLRRTCSGNAAENRSFGVRFVGQLASAMRSLRIQGEHEPNHGDYPGACGHHPGDRSSRINSSLSARPIRERIR